METKHQSTLREAEADAWNELRYIRREVVRGRATAEQEAAALQTWREAKEALDKAAQ